MGVGTTWAVLCSEAIVDSAERAAVVRELEAGGRDVVHISRAQMGEFCGYVLELRDGRGLPVIAMSSRAAAAFDAAQTAALRRHVAGFVHAPIDTIERVGGGGVRCMLAELF